MAEDSMLAVLVDDEGTPANEPEDLAKALGPSVQVALLVLHAALEAQPGFLTAAMKAGTVTIIQVPDASWGADIAVAWGLVISADRTAPTVIDEDDAAGTSALLDAARRRLARAGQALRPVELLALDASRTRTTTDRLSMFRSALRSGRAIYAVTPSPGVLLPPEVLEAADQTLVVHRPDAGTLLRFALDTCDASEEPIEPLPEEIAREVQPVDLLLAKRPGQTAARFLQRLQNLIRARRRPRGPGLEALPGMGEASTWARQVVEDLRAVAAGELEASELDRGVVLEGPPGTGKTSLARAIAATADVPFIAASLQDWQGARGGHLGTTLGAMRESFAEARRLAPCVLLVDEIDGFGDRATFDPRHRDYSRQVVLGFLEQLDGSHGRQPIIVIGCTNDASGLDPAILRPGRLEQVIQVSLPDEGSLVLIFRRHLGNALPEVDLGPLAEVAHARGASGADVERWCRAARGTARRARRPMTLDDLVAEVGEPPPPLTGTDLQRACVHEAGHAIAHLVLGAGVLRHVRIRTRGASLGYTRVNLAVLDGSPFITQLGIRARIQAVLAGRAAEIELLGEASGGSGGTPESDLASATRIATTAVAALGLDGDVDAVLWQPVSSPQECDRLLMKDAGLRDRVAAFLSRAMADTRAFMRELKPGVSAVADALAVRGHLEEGEVFELMRVAMAQVGPLPWERDGAPVVRDPATKLEGGDEGGDLGP